MYTFLFALLLFLPVAAILSTLVYAVCMVRRGMPARRAVLRQFCAFFVAGVLCCAGAVGISAAGPDTAEVSDAAAAAPDDGFAAGMAYIGAALVTGLSGIGGGIAVAAGAPAAIGATSEDPKAFGKALIFVALGEGIALYGLLVSILILAKV